MFEYDPEFNQVASYRNPYLKHCHEIVVYKRRLYLTSTGFDSLLGFDLDNNSFSWGLRLAREKKGLRGQPFNPQQERGPQPANTLHINNVFADSSALFVSGLRTDGLHAYTGRYIRQVASLPQGRSMSWTSVPMDAHG